MTLTSPTTKNLCPIAELSLIFVCFTDFSFFSVPYSSLRSCDAIEQKSLYDYPDNWNNGTIWKILRNYSLYPYYESRVQNLNFVEVEHSDDDPFRHQISLNLLVEIVADWLIEPLFLLGKLTSSVYCNFSESTLAQFLKDVPLAPKKMH